MALAWSSCFSHSSRTSDGHAADAQAFMSFVLSPAGQAVLAKYGFKPAH